MHDYRNEQMRSPHLSGVSWSETRLRDHLPETPVLSLITLTFRPEVDIVNENHIGYSLWQQSLAFISTIPGFQQAYWAPISGDPHGIVVLIQWHHGEAWQEFQLSFGFGLLYPLLQQKPVLNCCAQLNLPCNLAAGPGHILELVDLSVLHASNKYDPAERFRWVEEEWQDVIDELGSGASDITFPTLLYGGGSWLEDDFPSEYRTFLGLLLWKVPSGRVSWIQSPALNEKVTILTAHTAGQSSILTDSLFKYDSSAPINWTASLERFSGTILATQVLPPQYSHDKGFDYLGRWDLWRSKSIDEVRSGRRMCPLPKAFWCSMGAMSQHGFLSAGDVLPRSAPVPMVDVLWFHADGKGPTILAILRGLCHAIHDKLGSPRLRWGQEISKLSPEPRASMFGILIGKPVHTKVVLTKAPLS
ncbi:hypothetical protein AbraIFM66951_010122 [Aspergillus brasiliensis]|uniref:Uncharacterized protein n=1 Tax=Aspergillus brasiliensis TaxID=319629 RepID=A0A9W6DLV1_9EURO|nr:hypothetical protein AbraCBS73388_007011 [Aspergillus brasiliensis]GKZ46949.1 hypothetical protein AbraIFM66951_010122 [Aspergillus brasiliensis]